MKTPFKFKQFSVNQDQCAMKIGTDGVLLGAWATIAHHPFSILDIGAGTGVLGLMLAQRSDAEMIDAIEIDDAAYEQCVDNFESSPWSDRLFCYHAALEEFAAETDDTYDLIICNPPFHLATLDSDVSASEKMSKSRETARFQDAMPFEHLLESVATLLSEEGRFCVVIPYSEEEKFKSLAKTFSLFPQKIGRLRGTPSAEIKRSLIDFSFAETLPEISELIIETTRHNYTADYIHLTKDFYLKM